MSSVLKVVAPPDRQQAPVSGAAIAIEGLSHRFQLAHGALDTLLDIDLKIAPGEFVTLLGPSGCGKSTLLRLVAGLEKPSEGRITHDGVPVTRPEPSRVEVFQDPTLYPWRTVWQNFALGLEARGVLKSQQTRVDKALELVGLASFAEAHPHQLSGGMAQRAALARALVNDPSLLILDEPLGKLDSFTRMSMQAELVALWRRTGFSALLVTHDVDEAFYLSQRVIVLSNRPGRIIAEFRNDLGYPRRRGSPELAELRHAALRHLGLDETW